ncbi:MAG: peptidase S41 [Catenulispora sp.]|nr:peptidase S41 [Catenulispora sp.]
MAQTSYLRFPHLAGDLLTFVAEDDVWLAELPADPARPVRATRFTSDWQPARNPRLSPDGAHLAWVRRRDGAPEAYVAPVEGGDARRLTYWADERTDILDWLSPREVIVAGGRLPMRGDVRAHAVPIEGGIPLVLPYGTVHGLAVHGPGGAVLTRRGISHDASWWKRYRGGRAGKLWVDADGSGDFRRLLRDHEGNIDRPMWVGGRAAFLSDASGVSEIYSCLPDGADLRQHTDQPDGFYARHAAGDGTRIVFVRGGRLWLLETLDGPARPVEVRLVGTRIGRTEFPVSAGKNLGGFAADRTGRAAAVEVRGTLHWLATKDGPARALAVAPGVRARMPVVLGDTGYAAWVTDAGGEWSIEIGAVDGEVDVELVRDISLDGSVVIDGTRGVSGGSGDVGDTAATPSLAATGAGAAAEAVAEDQILSPVRRILTGEVTRVADMAASPDGAYLAVSTEDNRLLLVDVESGTARVVVSGPHYAWGTLAEDPAFSPDSKWVAWAEGTEVDGPRKIRIADVATLTPLDVTDGRFLDWSPTFTLDGRHLAFLSNRTFDPYYAEEVFDLYFMPGTRPYLVPLAAEEPSPFAPTLAGRPVSGADEPKLLGGTSGDGGSAGGSGAGARHPAASRIDAEGLAGRIVPFPVPAGEYTRLTAAKGGVLWLESFKHGALGDSLADPSQEGEKPRLRRYDFAKREALTLADEAHEFSVSGDGSRILVREGWSLRLQPADARPDNGEREPLDLERIRVTVDPVAERRQGLHEAWLLQRDFFWRDDLGGVDWQAVRDRYAPLAEAVATQDDFVDLLWEVQGELGTSHAYAIEDIYGGDPARRLGRLGADLERDADGWWRIARILPGEASVPLARSPFEAPGVGARVGDVLVAIDGRPVDAALGPGPLLAGKAGKPTEVLLWRDAEVGAAAVALLAEGASAEGGLADGGSADSAPVSADSAAGVGSGDGDGADSGADSGAGPGSAAGSDSDAASGSGAGSAESSSAAAGVLAPARGSTRRVVIVPLEDERLLRYQAWVADRRAHVHERSGGRLGYVHLPDQTARGWAAFHRDVATQTAREGLIVDTRDNRGGNTSALVVEQLMRRVVGWKLVRGKVPRTYPPQAVRGPLVAVCDEYSASDGDMINQHLKDRGVPVVGTRTWGGVVGIDSRFRLLDGTAVMQPKFMNWFDSVGYGLENHGCDPTVEVEYTPADANAGRDPQLDAAVDLALADLAERPAATPPEREWL